MGLTNRQRVFVEEYLKCWNATEAAEKVGYKHPNKQGPRLLVKVGIQELIQARLAEKQMSADEALSLLADMARGDLGDFMDITSMGFSLKLIDEDGNQKNTKLIHKIKQKTTTFIAKKESDEDREVHEIEIELYDAQAAIDKILRVAGKYKDNLDLTSKGKSIALITDEQHNRAMLTLADALRKIISGQSAEAASPLGTPERTPMVSTSQPSG